MTQTTPERSGRIVGRKAELATIEQFLDSDGPPRALMLTGGPGIGKTALWEAGVEAARERGLRVLAARANGAETQLCFAALIDLLDGIGTEELTQLPRPQQQALEVALYRAEPTGTAPAPAAISVGFLNALRSLAAQPLLVAVDDVQWLDAASAEAVAFAARRVDGHPVRFLFARRSRSPSPLRLPDGPNELQRIELTPLSIGATHRLLSDRLGLSLSRQVLRRIVDLTLGNPLFALELGRSLADSGPPKLGEEVPLPDSLEQLMGTRVTALPDPARRLVLAVALSGDLRVSELAEIEPPAALDDAVDLGVLVVDGGRVRPAHPLFATAAKARARAGEQRELHLVLAELATDRESRAAHLALAADHPDEERAAAAADAAARAAARGARQDAVVLAEHALRLTANPDERNGRVLDLAVHLNAAGEQARLTELLAPELESLPPGEARVRACLLLSDGTAPGVEVRRYLDRALAEAAGDVRLRAIVLPEIATYDALARVEQLRDAEQLAQEALEAGRGEQPEVERSALYALAWARSLRGQAIDDICERYSRVSGPAPYLAIAPDRVAGQRLLWRGDIVGARSTMTRLLELADERGEPISYALHRLHLCELALRTGAWSQAARFLDEASRDGDLIDWPCHDRCRALLAAGRGVPDETVRWVTEAVARAERVGVQWDLLESIRARGIAELLTDEPARAAKSLRVVWEHTQREGVDEPGAFPVAPDLVEALVELGELGEATAVIDRLRQLSEEQEHPWGLATARRCGAMVRLASDSYDEDAAEELVDVAGVYRTLGLPFDRARSLLSLGRAQRRLKKWGAARDSLEQAAAAFDELESPGWAERARAELARVGGRRRQASGELTPAEQRVAELAADGLANKEIASALVVTVRTVEAHLKQVYAKLGIRSRTQLARRFSDHT